MVKLRFLILVCLAFLAISRIPRSVLAVGDGWPMYGHDAAHTGHSSANGPNTPDLKWTYTDTSVIANPVVSPDGVIYFTSDGDIVALNPTGTVKWRRTTQVSQEDFYYLAIGPTGTVYAIDRSSYPGHSLEAIDPTDGSTLWTYPFASHLTYGRPTVGSDGTIYITATLDGPNSTGFAYAVNPDGTEKWKWDSQTDNCGIETTPALGSGHIYFQHNCLGLVALNQNTGAFLWENSMGVPFNSPSVGTDGTVYLGGAQGYFNAVNPDGAIKWQTPIPQWMYSTIGTISDDLSTVYRGDNDGNFLAFDFETGDIKWQYNVGTAGTTIDSAAALAANGILYFTSGATTATPSGSHGYLHAIRADNGQLLWKYEIGFVSSDPAIGPDGTLYIAGDAPGELGTGNVRALYAFQCADGTCAIPPHETLHTVTNLNDSGAGSLRQAFADSIYGDTIQFQPGLTGTIALATPITVSTRLTLNGPGADVITLDGGGAHAVFSIPAGKRFNVNNLTITNGKTAITVSGFLHIANIVFNSNNNPSGYGGALRVNGKATVSIDDSTFAANSANYGGAIYNAGTTTISSSTFSNNQANSEGGAILLVGDLLSTGNMTISNSTFTGNSAFWGGALHNTSNNTALIVINSTIAQNTASYGGGLYYSDFWGATTTLRNTIIANNSGSNCDEIPTNGGGNLQYPGTSCGSILVANPLLDVLADNGGPTWTMALKPGSPAIDAGDNTFCAGTPVNNLDQRGVSRPVDGNGDGNARCDVGAFEAPVPHTAAPDINYYTTSTPILTWNAVYWAISYEIEVNTDKTFAASDAFHAVDIPPGQLYVQITTPPLADGTYYWRTRAKLPNGLWGAWSSVEHFVVKTG